MIWQEECKKLISENQLSTALQYMEDKGVDVSTLRKEDIELEQLRSKNRAFTSQEHEVFIEAQEKLVRNLLKSLK